MYNDYAKREINAMIDEMRRYEDRRVGTPQETLGVFESGKHDDMVSACALGRSGVDSINFIKAWQRF